MNEPFRGAQDEVVSDGTLVIPQPMIRLNVLAAVPLIKKLFAKESEAPAQAQSKISLDPTTIVPLAFAQSYTPTLHLEVRLKKANDSGQGEIIFSGAFNTTENWRNFTQTIEIAKDKLDECEEAELILTWKNLQNSNSYKVWIDELKVERSSLEVLTWADYYPYGLVMREGTCSSYRYQYQGETAEKDKETGWNHFELREYDPVIGRWLSTDPYGEFWSSYVGMGNDPVNNIDPDGGFSAPGSVGQPSSCCPPPSKAFLSSKYLNESMLKNAKEQHANAGIMPLWAKSTARVLAAGSVPALAEPTWVGEAVLGVALIGAMTYDYYMTFHQTQSPPRTLVTPVTTYSRRTSIKLSGVYNISVSGPRYNGTYIGQSDDIARRIGEHQLTTFVLHRITVNHIYLLPNSIKDDRESLEQYKINQFMSPARNGMRIFPSSDFAGRGLLNSVNPMGGRVADFTRRINRILNQYPAYR